MTSESIQPKHIGSYTNKQRLFVRLFTAVLIDLTVLNLFDEYWDKVVIGSFTISLLAALLLQILLKITIWLEHRVGDYFKKHGITSKIVRFLSAWAILFGSKFAILWAINIAFGDNVAFKGAYHGVIPFIIVIVVMVVAEGLIVRFNKYLGD